MKIKNDFIILGRSNSIAVSHIKRQLLFLPDVAGRKSKKK